jgi:hypothetical protein
MFYVFQWLARAGLIERAGTVPRVAKRGKARVAAWRRATGHGHPIGGLRVRKAEIVVEPAEAVVDVSEIMAVLATLTKREALVIKLRFGLTEDGCSRTLEEVGAFFKVTRDRIRQIEAKALRKLRHPTRRKRLANAVRSTRVPWLALVRACSHGQ